MKTAGCKSKGLARRQSEACCSRFMMLIEAFTDVTLASDDRLDDLQDNFSL